MLQADTLVRRSVLASILLALAVAGGWRFWASRPPRVVAGAAAGLPDRRLMTSGSRVRVKLAGQVWLLEVAADDVSRNRGLSGRPPLSDHDGMLFVYLRPQPLRFWMAGCDRALDILFLYAS